MKTKVFKFMLPVFALLMAVSLAFATESEAFLNTGYIAGPTGPIPVQVDCDNATQNQCYYGGSKVFQDEDLLIKMTKSQ